MSKIRLHTVRNNVGWSGRNYLSSHGWTNSTGSPALVVYGYNCRSSVGPLIRSKFMDSIWPSIKHISFEGVPYNFGGPQDVY